MKSVEKRVLAECLELLKKQEVHMSGYMSDVIKHAIDRTTYLVKQEAMTRINRI